MTFWQRHGVVILAVTVALLAFLLPVLYLLDDKVTRVDVLEIVDQVRPGPPYVQDKQFIASELTRLAAAQLVLAARIEVLATQVAELRVQLEVMQGATTP